MIGNLLPYVWCYTPVYLYREAADRAKPAEERSTAFQYMYCALDRRGYRCDI